MQEKINGVTLISLAITIVVLLILAGVTLSLTIGDTGIITQAQKAKASQEIAAIKEDMQLAILDKELEKGGTGLTKEELEEIAGNYGELQEDGNTIKTDEGYEIKIDEIYQEGGGTIGGDVATDEELAELQQKIDELEKTVEDLNNTKTELEGTIEDLNNQIEEEQGNSAALQEQVDNLTKQVDNLNKTKEQLESTISDLNTQIAELQKKQSTGTAVASDVLSGKTFSNSSNVNIAGTMENRGAVSQSLNAGGSYTIPAGYHNGSGKVTANTLASQTSATAGAGQILNGYTAWVNGSKVTGTMKSYTSGSTAITTSGRWGFDTTYGPWVYIPANGYYATAHWLNIPWATIKGSLGDAAAGNVLSGKTFTSTNGVKITGSMPNRGTLNWNPSSSTTYTVPAGYYSGGTLNSSGAYNAGYSAGNSAGRSLKTTSGTVTSSSSKMSMTATNGSSKSLYYATLNLNFTHTVVSIVYQLNGATSGSANYFRISANGEYMCCANDYYVQMSTINSNWQTNTSIKIPTGSLGNKSISYTVYYI